MAISATPIALPAWRLTENSVAACAVSAIEIVASAVAWLGAIANPNAVPMKKISNGMAHTAVDGPTSAATATNTPLEPRPPAISGRGPTRRNSRVETWMPMIPPTASVKVDKPECRAEYPSPF